jgi:hypothetical protein
VSRWHQIHRYFAPHVLLIGYLYARWLRARRRVRYLLGGSGRRWQVEERCLMQVRIIE